jgi:hypothetical protein
MNPPPKPVVDLLTAAGEQGAVCSCGVPDCREFGWPHEWDPIACGDSCAIVPPPGLTVAVYLDAGTLVSCWHTPHRVTEPYQRWGSGYACVACIETYGDR